MRFSDQYGFYELNPFPGCNQVCISNHAFIYQEHRGKGRGKKQHEERLKKAIELGYNLIMCTVRADNHIERHILRYYQWQEGVSFLNKETNTYVMVYTKHL